MCLLTYRFREDFIGWSTSPGFFDVSASQPISSRDGWNVCKVPETVLKDFLFFFYV